MSEEYFGPPLREVVARHDIGARKGLGQHFLFDLNLTRRIARAGGVKEASVLEIGAGPGGLTRALLAEGAGRVIAVERDKRCIAALAELSTYAQDRLTIIEADALTIDERGLLAGVPPPIKVVANLPYNIGTALLVRWLTAEPWPPWYESLTLMLQREVALRVVAPPGGKTYGRLSVLAQWRSTAKRLFDVSAGAFTPPPKVDSTVISLVPRAIPLAPCSRAALETVVAAAFGQRRKMLRSSLGTLPVATGPLLAAAGIVSTARAETLSVSDFAALARAYEAELKQG